MNHRAVRTPNRSTAALAWLRVGGPNADRRERYLRGVTNPDDATYRLDDLDALARRHGVLPVFRLRDEDGEDLEGAFLRIHREEASGDGLLVLEIGALDGSWTDHFLVGAQTFDSAASGLAEPCPSD